MLLDLTLYRLACLLLIGTASCAGTSHARPLRPKVEFTFDSREVTMEISNPHERSITIANRGIRGHEAYTGGGPSYIYIRVRDRGGQSYLYDTYGLQTGLEGWWSNVFFSGTLIVPPVPMIELEPGEKIPIKLTPGKLTPPLYYKPDQLSEQCKFQVSTRIHMDAGLNDAPSEYMSPWWAMECDELFPYSEKIKVLDP